MLSQTILPAFARALSMTLPAQVWYRSALMASGVFAWLLRLSGRVSHPQRFEQAILLNRLMAFLTRTGVPFPVRWRWTAESEAVLDAAATSGRGLVICSAHLPLIKVAMRALIETGRAPTVVIAAEPGPDGCIAVWGLRERLTALKVGPNVLLKTRTELRNGGRVLLLVDTVKGEYSPNIFHLAAAMRATVLFFTAELQADGHTAVRVFPAPWPACSNDEEIKANLKAIESLVKDISRAAGEDRFDRVPASRLT